jgi:DNA-binding CsgD family transcriptional regulator
MHACLLTGIACYFSWDRLTQDVLLVQDSTAYNYSTFIGLIYLGGLGALFAVSTRFEWHPPRKAIAWATAIACVTGIALAFNNNENIRICCICAQGLCSVAMLAFWARILSATDWRETACSIACSMMLAMVLVLAVRWYGWLLPLFLTIMPLAAGLAILRLTTSMDWIEASEQESSNASTGHALPAILAKPFPWPLLSVYALCALVAQFFTGVVAQPYIINSNSITLFSTLITMGVMAGLLVWARLTKTRDTSGLFFLVLVILIAGLLLFSTGVLNSLILPIGLVVAATNCLYGIAWTVLSNLARRPRMRPVPTFAIGMLICGGSAGLYTGILARRSTGMSFSTVTSVAIAGIALFAVFYIFSSQLNNRTLQRTTEEAERAIRQAASTVPERLTAEQAARAVNVQRSRTAEEYGLTVREREVLPLVVQGMSNGDIANELIMSESTVKFHLKNIYAKCGVHTRSELSALFRL